MKKKQKKQKVQLAILGVFVFCMIFSFALLDVVVAAVEPPPGEISTLGELTPAGETSTLGGLTPSDNGESTRFGNPIGYETVDGVLAQFLRAIQGIIAVLAVLMIVVGGIIYMTAAGDQGRTELAKKAVTSAVIGLALALAAPAFLQQIYSIMGADAPDSAPVANKSVSEIILSTLNVLLAIIGTLAIIMLVVGGIMYMTSGGDDGRAETAKNTIKYSIVGLIVAITSLIVVTQISNLF